MKAWLAAMHVLRWPQLFWVKHRREAPVKIEISQESVTSLEAYANIPIAFMVNSTLDVEAPRGGEAEFRLTERRIDIPYVKDYDSIEGEGPASWPERFDLLNWAFILARSEGHLIGGAALAFATPEL